MTRLLFVPSVFVFITALARAEVLAPSEYFRSLASAKLEIITGDPDQGKSWITQLPYLLSDAILTVAGKNPEVGMGELSPTCDFQKFQSQLTKTIGGPAQSQAIDRYFSLCRSEIETGVVSRWANIVGMYRWKMHLDDHPLIRHVTLHLPGDLRLNGVLAMKGDGKKRPFVLIRPGIFSSSEHFLLERPFLIQLFEQGPFNVLMVENSSSKNFISKNPGFTVGGPTEGLENMQIARILRDPAEPISKLVGSVHIVGISLGGNSLFHTAGLDALQSAPMIQSYTAFCPVVDAQQTLLGTKKSGPQAVLTDIWISMRIWGLRDRISSLSKPPVLSWLTGKTYFWDEALKFAENSYPPFKGLNAGLITPPEYARPLWEASAEAPWMRVSQAPFLIVANEHDTIVPVEFNSAVLKKSGTWKNMGVSMIPEGFHCTLPVAYRWGVGASLLNGALLAHSPDYRFAEKSLRIDLGETAKGFISPRLTYEIQSSNQSMIVLRAHLKSGPRKVDFAIELPRKDLDFQNLATVLPEAESQMVERWLHQQMTWEWVENGKRSSLNLRWPQTL